MPAYKPRTQLVQSLIQITPWDRRHYIEDLMRLEQHLESPPSNFASGLARKNLSHAYPVETAALQRELHGNLVPLPVLYARLAAHHHDQQAAEAAEREQERVEEAQRYAQWIEGGGPPPFP